MEQDYKNNPKIKLSENSLLDDSYLDPKEHKLRITAYIDGDIYAELNKRAANGEGNSKYQTLMNELLRDLLFGKTNTEAAGDNLSVRVAMLESKFKGFLKINKNTSHAMSNYKETDSNRPKTVNGSVKLKKAR